MDAYDRERRDTKDPKTIGKRTKVVQEWWESLSDDKKAEARRVVESGTSWVHPRQLMTSHEAGEGQVKVAVRKIPRFETAPGDGKKAFTESSEASKDWVLNGKNILMDYLLTSPVEEDSAEKQEAEISLDEDGNPEVPTWAGQKLEVQQNLARAVFQAAYEVWDIAKFTKKAKAKGPWGLLIKSPMEYLDSKSIPEGFTMKDSSKWTKADLGLLWDHWQSQEAEEKMIVSFIDCKKEDAPLHRQFDRQVPSSSKKKLWVDVEEDDRPAEQNMDPGEVQKRGTSAMQELKEGDGSAVMGGSDGGDEEKEEEEAVDAALQQKRKRAGSGIETRRQKMLKEGARKGGVGGRRGVRTRNQTRRGQ
ncbi:hypothetical protein EDC04DRAFT_2608354 [Pisolithus marmoratus]|nr:hypothetical protein EDC04DRAFT_2608354 [Pisolithus marmoratus]